MSPVIPPDTLPGPPGELQGPYVVLRFDTAFERRAAQLVQLAARMGPRGDVQKFIEGTPKKVIVVPGKLVNIVV